jgi:hypothetical protein
MLFQVGILKPPAEGRPSSSKTLCKALLSVHVSAEIREAVKTPGVVNDVHYTGSNAYTTGRLETNADVSIDSRTALPYGKPEHLKADVHNPLPGYIL